MLPITLGGTRGAGRFGPRFMLGVRVPVAGTSGTGLDQTSQVLTPILVLVRLTSRGSA
jgi:hypothetical protein